MIEFGWRKRMQVKVRLEDGRELDAENEGLAEGQEIDRVVDGSNYPSYLNPIEKMHEVARKTRHDYYNRQN